DAEKVYPAVWTLAADPRRSLVLLKERLRPVEAVDAGHVRRLIERLDDDRFEEREKAHMALEELHDRVESALRRTLTGGQPSLELGKRIERLLEPKPLPPSRLRTLRAVQVLEQIGHEEARQLLKRLAQGAPDARETQQAAAALKRLAERAAPLP